MFANWWTDLWTNVQADFYETFVKDNGYELFLLGLQNTLIIVVFATLLGCLIGILVACAKVSYARSTPKRGIGRFFLKLTDALCNIYLTLFRGTPIVVQLLIMHYLIFTSVKNGVFVAILCFGINSGAYVAEIIRAGIMAVDIGQTEAGRSLGLSGFTTMWKIILPQAIKNILPALGNEFITLLKETSVAGYVTVVDLARAGELSRSNTGKPFFSLISMALVYLLMVMGLTAILKRVERRLRKSDRG